MCIYIYIYSTHIRFTCKAKWCVTLWLYFLSNCPIHQLMVFLTQTFIIYSFFYSHMVCLPPVQEILKQVTLILLHVSMESYLGKTVLTRALFYQWPNNLLSKEINYKVLFSYLDGVVMTLNHWEYLAGCCRVIKMKGSEWIINMTHCPLMKCSARKGVLYLH